MSGMSSTPLRWATNRSAHAPSATPPATRSNSPVGTAVGGFPFEEAARIMIEEIRGLLRHTEVVEQVVLFGYTGEQASALRRLVLEDGN